MAKIWPPRLENQSTSLLGLVIKSSRGGQIQNARVEVNTITYNVKIVHGKAILNRQGKKGILTGPKRRI